MSFVFRRGWVVAGLVIAVPVFLLVAGTVVEADWLGCERALTSTVTQHGTVSVQFAVHSVGCRYAGSDFRPAATEHHFPVGGVTLVTIAVLLVLSGVMFVLAARAVVVRLRTHMRTQMRAMAKE